MRVSKPRPFRVKTAPGHLDPGIYIDTEGEYYENQSKGGLICEAAIGGQKFSYEADK